MVDCESTKVMRKQNSILYVRSVASIETAIENRTSYKCVEAIKKRSRRTLGELWEGKEIIRLIRMCFQ